LSQGSSENPNQAIWVGKPWILPSIITRTVVIIVVAVMIFWLELFFGLTAQPILAVPLVFWTALIFFLAWIVSISHLLLLRASHTYTLLNDSLVIRTGIATSKTFTVAASGFGDMEVEQSVGGRMLNYGDIIIRTQSETDPERKMINVKNPQNVAAQIREVMARPIVRIDGQQPPPNQKK
jgi:uncharacterized membrane protein YdbT with pleckstrin-like domain